VVVTKTVWSRGPKIFTIWPFTEDGHRVLMRRSWFSPGHTSSPGTAQAGQEVYTESRWLICPGLEEVTLVQRTSHRPGEGLVLAITDSTCGHRAKPLLYGG
jgi:hypothetical protein